MTGKAKAQVKIELSDVEAQKLIDNFDEFASYLESQGFKGVRLVSVNKVVTFTEFGQALKDGELSLRNIEISEVDEVVYKLTDHGRSAINGGG